MKNLTPAPVTELIKKGVVRHYPKGQLVLYEGDVVSYLYYLKKGAIKAYDIDATGNEKIINVAGDGDFFPLLAIFDENGKIATFYSTLVDCELVLIPRQSFVELLQKDPEVSFYFLQWFTKRVKGLILRMSSLEKTDTAAKFHNVLYVLSQWHSRDRKDGWQRVNFPVNQQFLADMAGVTRESLNAVFKDAELNHIVRVPRSKVLEINPTVLQKCL